jgi:hypothetical protein
MVSLCFSFCFTETCQFGRRVCCAQDIAASIDSFSFDRERTVFEEWKETERRVLYTHPYPIRPAQDMA